MGQDELCTRDRILNEAIEIFAERGYKGTSIKAIAQKAEVSEMTIFRYFNTKTGIMNALLDAFSFKFPLENDVEKKIEWDLRQDLLLITKVYHEYVKKNEKVLIIKIKEGQRVFGKSIFDSPDILRKFLEAYFEEMHLKGKIKKGDFKASANAFICLNFGYFCSGMMADTPFLDIDEDRFIQNCVDIFVDGLLK